MTNLKVTITEVPDPLLPDNVIAVIDGTPIVAAGKNKQEAWKELMISLAITIAHNSDLDYKELTADELKDSPYQGSAELTDQDYDQLISQNVEKMWGSLEMASLDYFEETGKITGSFRFRLLSLMRFHQWRVEKAAHVACAEKYTAIIEQKDKEIERLRQALDLIIGENDDDPERAVRNMKNIASDYLIQNEKA